MGAGRFSFLGLIIAVGSVGPTFLSALRWDYSSVRFNNQVILSDLIAAIQRALGAGGHIHFKWTGPAESPVPMSRLGDTSQFMGHAFCTFIWWICTSRPQRFGGWSIVGVLRAGRCCATITRAIHRGVMPRAGTGHHEKGASHGNLFKP